MRMTVSAIGTNLRLVSKIIFLSAFTAMGYVAMSQSSSLQQMEAQADTLMKHEDFEGAIKIYSKIISETGLKEKSQYKPLYKRAVGYYSLSEFEKALTDINRFITEFPETAQARILRALIYRQLEKIDEQLVDVEKALALQNLNPELVRWHATLMLEKNEFAKAKEDLLQVKTFTDDAELETNLGLVYYSMGNLDSALTCINKAIELDVTYPASYIYAGSFCVQDGKFETALEYLNLALRIDPANRSAIFYKGVALVELKKTDEGCRCLRKAFAAGEDDAADYLKEYCYEVYK